MATDHWLTCATCSHISCRHRAYIGPMRVHWHDCDIRGQVSPGDAACQHYAEAGAYPLGGPERVTEAPEEFSVLGQRRERDD